MTVPADKEKPRQTGAATNLETVGEQLVGRPLAKEKRAGVTHYVCGQHHATIEARAARNYSTDEPMDVARVTYVDQGGHACVVLACRTASRDWFPTWVGRAGQTFKEDVRRVPEGFTLSPSMLAAINLADGRVA